MIPLTSDDIWALRQLQRVGYKSAAIGGGAVRDAYFDRPPNDIDIFVWSPLFSNETIESEFRNLDENSLAVLFDLGNTETPPDDDFHTFTFNMFGDHDFVKRLGREYDGRGNHISTVFSVYKASVEMEYQIILVNKPPIEYITKNFDIGLCMCYCNGTKMRYTNEFLRDAHQKTLTICGELTEEEYNYTINNHIVKMKSRFPDFTVVDNLKGTF